MPWTESDVDEHKKGLTPAQKKKWVEVANGILKQCKADGGKESECAAKAIRIANSKFSEVTMKETMKLVRAALQFTEQECFAKLVKKEEGKPRCVQMVAYSGKIIPKHWFWGDLAIDTSGMKISKKDIPILEDHLTSRKIGFGRFGVNENHAIIIEESTLVDTPFAAEFVKLSDQGFPYQASIYATPKKIQRLTEGEETEVNGFKMKGPGTVWRESVLNEGSICTFGADSNTKSAAMSENEEVALEITQLGKSNQEEVTIMDLAKLKAEHPDLYNQVVGIGKQEAGVTFAAEKKTLTDSVTTLTAENTQLKADKVALTAANAATETRVLKLEKKESIRVEEEIRTSADAIFTAALASANVPERLYPKVKKQIDHNKFVKDEKLDVVAFKAAIATELKDWAPVEGESVIGISLSGDGSGADGSDALVDRMLSHVGQTPAKPDNKAGTVH